MPTATHCLKQRSLLMILLLLLIGLQSNAQKIPLLNAFAHNDYFHKRPLFDALDNGYTHIEADVYLHRGKLVVAHILPFLKNKGELENLYLKPLQDCITGNNNTVAAPAAPVTLMIDIKSGANQTYKQLEILLNKYRAIISGYEDGKFVQRQITVVLSGHTPLEMIRAQNSRFAFIDADLMKAKLADTLTKEVYQMASCKYSKLLKWNGKGDLPDTQRQRLCEYVSLAHKNGQKVRLWASPDNSSVWKTLLSCGVDLINTDKLVKLKNFLLEDERVTGVRNEETQLRVSEY